MAKIEEIVCCAEPHTLEYWHENKDCDDYHCYVIECRNCDRWYTLCGMTNEDA